MYIDAEGQLEIKEVFERNGLIEKEEHIIDNPTTEHGSQSWDSYFTNKRYFVWLINEEKDYIILVMVDIEKENRKHRYIPLYLNQNNAYFEKFIDDESEQCKLSINISYRR